MKTKISLWTRLVVAFAITIGIGSFAFATSAQAADDTEIPDYRLQISPSRTNIESLKPGETYKGSFSVQNTGKKPYNFRTEITPYSVAGENYDADFNLSSKYTQMTDWIEITSATTAVEPNHSVAVNYTITIPENAPGGNQNVAIAVTLDDGDAAGIMTLQRAAYIIVSNVDGNTVKEGKILKNTTSGFIFTPPIVAKSVVKNTGNVYTNAIYELEVRNFFGNKLAYTNVSEDHNGDKVYETRVIFPETERYNEVSWDGAPQLGLFKVKQTIRIFDETDTIEKLVFLCPIWFLVLIIIFVFVAVFWIVSRITRRKRE